MIAMLPPTIIAPIKLKVFRIMAVLSPKYLASIGIVSIPTIFRVVINTERTEKLTPVFNKIPASGYAIKPGIMETEPMIAADKYAPKPASSPKYSINTLSEIKYRTVLTTIITDNKVGRIFRNIIIPFFIAFSVFFLSKTKEIRLKMTVIMMIAFMIFL